MSLGWPNQKWATGTTDPGAGQDISQGFEPLSLYENTVTGTVWICVYNTRGAAVWARTAPSSQGVPGPEGEQGPEGEPGPPGPPGQPGSSGAIGPQGLPGLIGPIGFEGEPGDEGTIGPPGPIGAMGPQGPTGPPGPAGAVTNSLIYLEGDQGEEGSIGPPGPAGAAGASSTFSGAGVFSSTVQTFASSTPTAVNFPSHEFDTDAYHSDTTNNSRITIPTGKGGVRFLIQGAMSWVSNLNGERILQLRVNGDAAQVIADVRIIPVASILGSGVDFMQVARIFKLNDGDFVELVAQQTTIGNLNDSPSTGTNGGIAPFLTAVRLG